MKTFTILFISSLLVFHQPNNAKYEFDLGDDGIELIVILQAHELQSYYPTEEAFSAVKTANYLLKYLNLTIDGQAMKFDFLKSEKTERFMYLKFRCDEKVKPSANVHLKLDAFLHVSKNFTNQVVFSYKDVARSYNMNSQRTEIELNVDNE